MKFPTSFACPIDRIDCRIDRIVEMWQDEHGTLWVLVRMRGGEMREGTWHPERDAFTYERIIPYGEPS